MIAEHLTLDAWTRWLVQVLACKGLQQCQQTMVVMFWAGIIGNELVGPYKVPDGVKMNALTYRNFLQANFIP